MINTPKRPLVIFLACALLAALAWGGRVYIFPPQDVAARIEAARILLSTARVHHTVTPNVDLEDLPIPDVKRAEPRKSLFIAALLTPILRENARITSQRARTLEAPQGSPEYSALATAYGLSPQASRTALLARIDTVPPSLALAQAAIESAWGQSRFATEGNAFFGERTYDENTAGITPGGSTDSAAFKVKSFASGRLSVRSFMKTLNTHAAYRDFRQQRAALRAEGQEPTGLALAPFLHGYSEIGAPYIQRIVDTIDTAALDVFDRVELLEP